MESGNLNNNYPIQKRQRERVRLPADIIQGYINSISINRFVRRFEMRKRGYEKMLRVRFNGDVEKLQKFIEENSEHHYFHIKNSWDISQKMTGKLRFYKRLIERRQRQDEYDERKTISFLQSDNFPEITVIKKASLPKTVTVSEALAKYRNQKTCPEVTTIKRPNSFSQSGSAPEVVVVRKPKSLSKTPSQVTASIDGIVKNPSKAHPQVS